MIKHTLIAALLIATLSSCKKEATADTDKEKTTAFVPYTHDKAENAVIYEANIRQYSPEGTFEAFTKHIPKLKELGVKVLWVMPVYPIGEKNRKEGLGSYYSIRDYRGINPEFGTKEDFKKLIATAHENGIYVIMDWVANHTAWDHPWITEHPDYYVKDKKGNLVSPYDWTDVAELDYANPEVRKTMVSEMSYWVTDFNIDGFRCDMAHEVPTDFWNDAVGKIAPGKTLFMLGETENADLLEKAFDVVYGWELHHITNDIAQGKKNVKAYDDYIRKNDSLLQPDDFKMNFTSNHDENTWSGTEYERMGDAVELFAALTYMTPGMPLIYNGQEYDSKVRLKFFEKDQITHKKGKMYPVYEKLGKLKNENPALNGGKKAAAYKRIGTSSDLNVLAFNRSKDHKEVLFIGNLTKAAQSFTVPVSGVYLDYMKGTKVTLSQDQKYTYQPWEYKILIKQ